MTPDQNTRLRALALALSELVAEFDEAKDEHGFTQKDREAFVKHREWWERTNGGLNCEC